MQLHSLFRASIYHVSHEEREKFMQLESAGPQLDRGGKLTGWTLQNAGAFIDRGWVMQVHPQAMLHDMSEFSPGLREIVELASVAKADYIHFDILADLIPTITDSRN